MGKDIKERFISILSKTTGVSDISENNTFSDLGCDSLDTLETIIETEREFDINIPYEDVEKFSSNSSVGNAIDYIYNKVNK